MTFERADGSGTAAAALRQLADRIEQDFPAAHAVIEWPDDAGVEIGAVEVTLVAARPVHWDLVQLRSALARPGD